MNEHELKFLNGKKLYPHQKSACSAVLSGRDVLLVSPTGSGKSVCYLAPTQIVGGPTIVVSPLVALMDDQSLQARALGFLAARIHGGISPNAQWVTISQWLSKEIDLLFISPERLQSEKLLRSLRTNPPRLLVVDEAHCVDTWGKRFRPTYQTLAKACDTFRPASILAMTATASSEMRTSIAHDLGLKRPINIVVPFLFANISISAKRTQTKAQRLSDLKEVAYNPNSRRMVVFCIGRNQCEEIAAELQKTGVNAFSYHAGKTFENRRKIISEFSSDRNSVLVTTSAYEMGVNIPDIRTVVHFGLPLSLVSYVQGIGRAGRDGNHSDAILMFSDSDLDRLDFMLSKKTSNSSEITSDSKDVSQVYAYATSSNCRRLYLNRHFFAGRAPLEICGRCDNCIAYQIRCGKFGYTDRTALSISS